MTVSAADAVEPSDRLYDLLPAVYRMRDAAEGLPLRDLLRVIAEQVDVVEHDIAALYENWFVETAADWAVPYLADVIGYTPLSTTTPAGDGETARDLARTAMLVPRRDVANTLRNRRRKGTLAILEELAADVAGWPSAAVEFYRLLAWTQSLNHQRPTRGRTVDLRDVEALDRLEECVRRAGPHGRRPPDQLAPHAGPVQHPRASGCSCGASVPTRSPAPPRTVPSRRAGTASRSACSATTHRSSRTPTRSRRSITWRARRTCRHRSAGSRSKTRGGR